MVTLECKIAVVGENKSTILKLYHMMFIEQGINKTNVFGKYLMGSVLIFFASSNGTNTIDCCDIMNQLLQVHFPTGNDTMMRFLNQI
jgi:hypothetical protein